ncbi:MAG: esterase/lipase family protein, partial [Coriobacteriia bacterium]
MIVIPGITATSLVDEYPIGGEEIWSAVLNKEFQRLTLHPDDLQYEAQGPARVQAGRLFELTYKDLILALRHELSPSADQPTPVFGFSYDWRHDVRATAKELGQMVEEVVARTRLLRHYASWYPADPKVHLVAHSMGGLVICEYLSQFAQRKRIARVCTLCTPFQGSIEAVCKLLTGIGYLSGEQPKERERESARTFQAVYQLLPSFKGAATRVSTGEDVDLFSASEWQTSIIESMSEFVRLHSVSGSGDGLADNNNRLAAQILDAMLTGARQVQDDVRNLGQAIAAAGMTTSDWLAIV